MALCLMSCGGLPSGYEESLGLSRGVSSAVTCSSPSQGAIVAAIVVFDNPGQYPIEITSVEVVDASLESVEAYILSTPVAETIGFGTTLLSDPAGSNPILEAAWDNRAAPPAEVAPEMTGSVVVIIPPPGDDGVSYVKDFTIDVSVDGTSRS